MGIDFQKLPVGRVEDWRTALDRIQSNLIEAFLKVPDAATPNVVTVTSDYAVKGNEDVIHVDSQRGPVKITMLPPSSANRPLTVKQINLQGTKTSVNPVTIASKDGSASIAGKPSIDLDNTGTGSVSFSSSDTQHWPATNSGGNPPAGGGSGIIYVGIPPIFVAGNQIGIKQGPPPPPTPPITPWVAPVPYGTQNTFISNTAGTEAWAAECMVDFTGSPGSLTAYLWFEASVSGGTGIVNVRVGGTANRAIDGTVAVTWPSETATTPTPRSVSAVLSPPSGLQRVTLTTQCTAGQKLTVSAVNLLFR